MSKWKHLTEAERKLIKSLLAKDLRLNEIADLVGKDPLSLWKTDKIYYSFAYDAYLIHRNLSHQSLQRYIKELA